VSLAYDAVLITHNEDQWVAGAMESILGQTLPPQQIFVIDDGSTDGTQEVLAPYAGRARIVRQDPGKGIAAARNLGIALGRAPLIAFLDGDDLWAPHKSEQQVLEFERWPDLVLCSARSLACNAALQPLEHQPEVTPRSGEFVFDELYLLGFPLPPSVTMARREAFERCGGFDERMSKSQDIECWLRIAMFYRVSCLPQVLARRRIHPASVSSRANAATVLRFDKLCFELCEEAARRFGVELPIPAKERKVVSHLKRLKLMLEVGDFEGARVFREELQRLGRFGLALRGDFYADMLKFRLKQLGRALYALGAPGPEPVRGQRTEAP